MLSVDRLSTNQRTRYVNDGIVFPVPALTPDQVARYRSDFDRTRARLGTDANPHDLRQPQVHLRWAYEMCLEPRILDAVEDLVGEDILVCRGTVFWKDAHSPGFYSYHQDTYDLGFSTEHADKFVTAWIALTDSNLDNGCMQVLLGTQRTELPHSETLFEAEHDKNSAVSRGLTVDMAIDPDQLVPVILEPGQMSLHHANLVHGSGPNNSDRGRIGVVFRYQAPYVKQARPLHHPVILARGKDSYGYYEHLAQPPTEDVPAGLQSNSAFIHSHPEGSTHQRQSAYLSGRE